MNSLALNSNHDLYINNGQIARISSSDAIIQLVKTRLLLVREEWFMDLSAGLPWFSKMMGRNPNPYKIRSYVAKEIILTEGVSELKSLELVYNNAERKLDILFSYTDIYGNTVEGTL